MILLSLVYKVNSVRLCFNKNTAGRRVCLGRGCEVPGACGTGCLGTHTFYFNEAFRYGSALWHSYLFASTRALGMSLISVGMGLLSETHAFSLLRRSGYEFFLRNPCLFSSTRALGMSLTSVGVGLFSETHAFYLQ